MRVKGGNSFRVTSTTLAQTVAHFILTYFAFLNLQCMQNADTVQRAVCTEQRRQVQHYVCTSIWDARLGAGSSLLLLLQSWVGDRKAWMKLELLSKKEPPVYGVGLLAQTGLCALQESHVGSWAGPMDQRPPLCAREAVRSGKHQRRKPLPALACKFRNETSHQSMCFTNKSCLKLCAMQMSNVTRT